MDKNSKIYIAGHKGLVGSAIWKNLENKGYTNLVGRTIEELNLMDANAVADFFSKENPEFVFLAAAKVGGIVANNTYRGQFIYENLMIQNNVIHNAYQYNVKKLLFLGSTCIYPGEAPQPMAEDCLLTSPLEYTNEPYAIAKIAGIKMCESYNIQYNTNFISVMPTNLYGPNDNFDLEKSHVLPALLRKIYLGKSMEDNNWEAVRKDLDKNPVEGVNGNATQDQLIGILSKYGISLHRNNGYVTGSAHEKVDTGAAGNKIKVEIWGSGKPMREFLWSEEMADACVYLMENVDFSDVVRGTSLRGGTTKQSHELSTNINGEIRNTHINIGTGKEISIRELAFLIKEKIGFKGELIFNANKPDGTLRKLTNVSKLHSLGWHHKIEIEEGVDRMYKWYTS